MASKTQAEAVEEQAIDKASASEEALKQRLYQEAMREVRDSHIEEFNAIVTQKYAAEGLTYRPRLTAAERAAAQIKRIAEAAGLTVSIGTDESDLDDDGPDEV
jgi:K+-transporting ATPase c subunit